MKKLQTESAYHTDSYVIEDYLKGIILEPYVAVSQFEQQLLILKSVQSRFESSLFEIKQMTIADVFDSEIDSAKELLKKNFFRAAGAITGVILEKHLFLVCQNHNLKLKNHPTINDLNTALKDANIIDLAKWRLIQRLGDLRNLCSHNKGKEPTSDDINDLISDTEKIIKTVF